MIGNQTGDHLPGYRRVALRVGDDHAQRVTVDAALGVDLVFQHLYRVALRHADERGPTGEGQDSANGVWSRGQDRSAVAGRQRGGVGVGRGHSLQSTQQDHDEQHRQPHGDAQPHSPQPF